MYVLTNWRETLLVKLRIFYVRRDHNFACDNPFQLKHLTVDLSIDDQLSFSHILNDVLNNKGYKERHQIAKFVCCPSVVATLDALMPGPTDPNFVYLLVLQVKNLFSFCCFLFACKPFVCLVFSSVFFS